MPDRLRAARPRSSGALRRGRGARRAATWAPVSGATFARRRGRRCRRRCTGSPRRDASRGGSALVRPADGGAAAEMRACRPTSDGAPARVDARCRRRGVEVRRVETYEDLLASRRGASGASPRRVEWRPDRGCRGCRASLTRPQCPRSVGVRRCDGRRGRRAPVPPRAGPRTCSCAASIGARPGALGEAVAPARRRRAAAPRGRAGGSGSARLHDARAGDRLDHDAARVRRGRRDRFASVPEARR